MTYVSCEKLDSEVRASTLTVAYCYRRTNDAGNNQKCESNLMGESRANEGNCRLLCENLDSQLSPAFVRREGEGYSSLYFQKQTPKLHDKLKNSHAA